ncbi:MAG: uracil phosphoribosyltransferase [Clostridia bacterium]|nr:uracil phosphoribosyltransferase [Clostridia bacterium]
MKDYKNVHILDHPLIRHKVAIIRNKNTDTKNFRELIGEIATLMAYEAFKDVPTQEITVETPLETVKQTVVKENSVAIVPILRAGLGMVDGILTLFPAAKIGHIGLYRDETTLEPQEYYCKLPVGIDEKVVMVVDPMLATGGSSVDAINMLKKRGCKRIKLLSIIGAPEGVEKVAEAHPDVEIYVSTLDRCLNENGYILPGLGDAGDRIFGTK